MSDTPRTDEQINGKPCTRFEVLAGDSLRNASVPSEFARGLERELNAANDRIKRLEEVRAIDDSNSLATMLAYEIALAKIKRLTEAGSLALGYAAKGDLESADEVWDKAKEDKL